MPPEFTPSRGVSSCMEYTMACSIRDRMLAVYRNQRPAHIPVSIYKRYLPTGQTERLVRNMGLGISDYYPPVTLLAPPWHTSPGYVSEVKGADLQIRFNWEHGRPVETRTYKTPLGEVSQETTKDPNYGSDWIRKHYIEKLDDYRVMQYIVQNTVFKKSRDDFAARKSDLGEDGVLFARLDRSPYQKVLMELAGPERFLEDLACDPDPVLELLNAMTTRMDEAFTMVLDTKPDVVWQPDNVSADMTPPDAFQKFCAPFYNARGARLKDAGIPYVIHMDGRLKALKPLIATCNFSVVESFSLPMVGNDMPLAEAFAAWPGKVIVPNFPSPLCLQENDKIVEFLVKLLEQVGKSKPFMLQVSEDIPTAHWQRVLPVLCQTFERLS